MADVLVETVFTAFLREPRFFLRDPRFFLRHPRFFLRDSLFLQPRFYRRRKGTAEAVPFAISTYLNRFSMLQQFVLMLLRHRMD